MTAPLVGGIACLVERTNTDVPLIGNPYRSNYAVTANGQRLLVNTQIEDAPSPVNIILNWTALLNK